MVSSFSCGLRDFRSMSRVPQSGRSRWVTMAIAFCCFVVTLASRGGAAPPQSTVERRSRFAIADFDGDSRPDFATVQVGQVGAWHARYRIDFELSAGARHPIIDVTAPIGGLDIAPLDVNGDRSLDLVVTTAWLNKPVAVLLNDGHGNFSYREAAAFPRLAWRFEAGCSADSVRVRDASAELTLPASADQTDAGLLSVRPKLARLVFSPAGTIANRLRFPVSGRAPPALVLHV
jgi:hypothetical protein